MSPLNSILIEGTIAEKLKGKVKPYTKVMMRNNGKDEEEQIFQIDVNKLYDRVEKGSTVRVIGCIEQNGDDVLVRAEHIQATKEFGTLNSILLEGNVRKNENGKTVIVAEYNWNNVESRLEMPVILTNKQQIKMDGLLKDYGEVGVRLVGKVASWAGLQGMHIEPEDIEIKSKWVNVELKKNKDSEIER